MQHQSTSESYKTLASLTHLAITNKVELISIVFESRKCLYSYPAVFQSLQKKRKNL